MFLMESEQKLWIIIIRYDIHHIDGTDDIKTSYTVIGRDEDEALEKAHSLFSKQGPGRKELIENGRYVSSEYRDDNYRESIREYRKISPAYNIYLDAQKFKLTPRISDDGRNIEFIVNEKQ